MIKKVTILACILLGTFLSSCSAYNGNGIFKYFDLPKDKLLKNLGSNFIIVYTGAEGSYEGYEYSKRGIIIVFEDDGSVGFIQCDNKVEFNGARAGMNFKQVQDKLGKTKIKDTWYETQENKAYEIEYLYGDLILQFISFEKDGKDSRVTIYRKPPGYNG